jgi:hypothetical protein
MRNAIPTVIIEDSGLRSRHDRTELVRLPRSWPRATREVRPLQRRADTLRVTIWFAVAGLMTVVAIYLVA